MFCWYIGTAIMAVGYVFRDPRFDHRLLVVGAVVPLLDGFLGGAGVLHSVTASVAVLAVLMAATAGRKPIRKMLLGLPIGMFLHLVFGGAWTDGDVFWWPFTGVAPGDAPFPITERLVLSVVLEAIGIALCVWLWRVNGLAHPARRRRFLADGQLVAVPSR